MMVKENTLWPGWETEKCIGKGGFGSVYEIRRNLFGSQESAALKVITIPQSESEINELRADGYDQKSISDTFTQHMQSIVNDYSIMRKMSSCSNIVRCDDVRFEQHADGIGWDIFIKMELLTPIIDAFPRQLRETVVLKAGKDLCNALVACKQYGIIHRDIKPQNIFISDAGDFKLGDFGIAKTIEKTMGGTKIGTYKYMAPEVFNNQPYGMAADIYSLGLVLYWMLNDHRMPFLPLPPATPTFAQEEEAKQRRFQGDPIPAPKNGSAALKAIVLKACAFDPADRYESAAQMLAALEQVERTPATQPTAQPNQEITEILPIPSAKETEVTAANYQDTPIPAQFDSEKTARVRAPHNSVTTDPIVTTPLPAQNNTSNYNATVYAPQQNYFFYPAPESFTPTEPEPDYTARTIRGICFSVILCLLSLAINSPAIVNLRVLFIPLVLTLFISLFVSTIVRIFLIRRVSRKPLLAFLSTVLSFLFIVTRLAIHIPMPIYLLVHIIYVVIIGYTQKNRNLTLLSLFAPYTAIFFF